MARIYNVGRRNTRCFVDRVEPFVVQIFYLVRQVLFHIPFFDRTHFTLFLLVALVVVISQPTVQVFSPAAPPLIQEIIDRDWIVTHSFQRL